MSTQHFDATAELKKVRQHKAIRRRKSYQQSRLAKIRTELVLLRKKVRAIVKFHYGCVVKSALKRHIPL